MKTNDKMYDAMGKEVHRIIDGFINSKTGTKYNYNPITEEKLREYLNQMFKVPVTPGELKKIDAEKKLEQARKIIEND